MKENLKKTKGITLIALVITIVVLLILAGVSIAMLTGQNGILTQATNADVETRGAAVQEAKDLWEANKTLDESTNLSTAQTRDELLADLQSQGLLTAEEVAIINETGQITIGSRTIVFGTNALTLAEMFENAQSCDKTDGTCTDKTHLHIGDYVDYTPGTGSTTVKKADTGYDTGNDAGQSYSVDTSTTWRVLGMDESGHVLLTSGSPIKKSESDPYLIMQGAESYINCVATLNKVCSIYNNSSLAEETRSITIDDINNVVGVKVEGTNVYKESDPEKTNIDIGGFLGNSYTYQSGDYAPENYMNDEYGTSVTRKKEGDKENYSSYGYMYDSLGVNQRIYNMLFAGINSSSNYAKSYWLASPGSFDGGSCAVFGPGGVGAGVYCGFCGAFISDGRWNAFRFAVRPVVVLKSDISIDDVPKSDDQSEKEDDWSQYDNNSVDSGYVDEGVGQVD